MGSWAVSLNDVFLIGGEDLSSLPVTGGSGFLTSPPAGLGVPGLRVEDQSFPQRDGVAHYSDWYEPRIITLEDVSIRHDDCSNCPSARLKARDLMEAWSRNCGDTELVLFTDCHEPLSTFEDREVNGPFGVIGRPRVADLEWIGQGSKSAQATLRFDSVDHRMYVLDADGAPGSGGKSFSFTRTGSYEPFGSGGGGTTSNGVPNPGFETASPFQWTVSNARRSTSSPSSGTACLEMGSGSGPTTPWSASAASASFPVVPGRAFNFSCKRRFVAVGGSLTITLRDNLGGVMGTYSFAGQTPLPSWFDTQFSGVVSPGASSATVEISCASQGSITYIYIDDVSYTEVIPDTTDTPSQEEVLGSICAPAIVEFTGPLHYPRFYVGPDSYLGVDTVIESSASSIVVDTSTGTAWDPSNGFDFTSSISGDPFLQVPDGVSDFSLKVPVDSYAGDVSGSVSVSYRPAVISA